MWKLLIMSVIGCTLWCCFMNHGKASSKGQLKSFHYNWSDSSKAGCEEVFQAEADGNDYVKLTVKSFDAEGNAFVHTGRVRREEFMAGLQRLSERRGLDKWNGFAAADTSKLGNNFKLEARYSDGSKIAATGTNTVPDGYGPAIKDIRAYFKENCK